MKLLILLFLGTAATLPAAHMRVTVKDGTSKPVTNCVVVGTPYGGGTTNGTDFVTNRPITNTTDTAGQTVFSNIVAAAWQVTIYSTKFGTTYLLNVTNQTTNVFAATECSPSVTNASALVPFSQAAATARFAPISSVPSGVTTNIQLAVAGAFTNTFEITNGLIKAITTP